MKQTTGYEFRGCGILERERAKEERGVSIVECATRWMKGQRVNQPQAGVKLWVYRTSNHRKSVLNMWVLAGGEQAACGIGGDYW